MSSVVFTTHKYGKMGSGASGLREIQRAIPEDKTSGFVAFVLFCLEISYPATSADGNQT